MKNPNKTNGFSYSNNKSKIDEWDELHKQEELITKNSLARNLNKISKIEIEKWDSILEIHKLIFGDFYNWAGNIRKYNIGKGEKSFRNFESIETDLKKLVKSKIKNEKDLAKSYLEMNEIHPLPEGNGRAGRIWLQLAAQKHLNKTIDFSNVSRDIYMFAMISSDSDQGKEIQNFITKNLVNINQTNPLSDLIKNIDTSYYYEHQNKYSFKNIYEKYSIEKTDKIIILKNNKTHKLEEYQTNDINSNSNKIETKDKDDYKNDYDYHEIEM